MYSPLKEGHCHTGASPAKGYEDGQGPGEPDVQREAEVTGLVQPEEKAKRRFYWGLQPRHGRIQGRQSKALLRSEYCGMARGNGHKLE